MSQGTLGLQQAGQQNPLFGGMPPQMAGLLQMGAPYLQQMFTQQTGMLPGPFMGGQNYADFQSQMEDQRQMMAAMQRSSNADTSNLYAFIRGSHHTMRLGWGPEQQRYGQTMAQGVQQAMPFLGPMIGSEGQRLFMPNQFAAQQMMQMGEGRLDPVTGRPKVEGARMGEMAYDVQQQLYGPGANASATRGFTMDRIGEMLRAGNDRGMGPVSIRSSLSDADIKQLRQGGGLTQSARQNLSQAEAAALTGSNNIDQTLQDLEGGRMVQWAEKMSGAMSAMRDLFGPGKPMEEMFEAMNAMTQGGFSRFSPEQMEQKVREMRQLAKQSSLSMDQMMSLQVTASNAAQRHGGSREAGVEAAMHAAAWGAAFQQGGTGRADFALAGMDLDALIQQDAMLTAQAQASPVYRQLAATAAIGDQMQFAGGSEAAALMKAIRGGNTSYTFGGQEHSVHMDPEKWAKMMAQGAGISESQAQAIRMANNEHAAQQYNLQSTVRELQWEVDIAPNINQSFANMLAGGGVRNASALAERLTAEVRGFKPGVNQTAGEARSDLIARMGKMIQGQSNLGDNEAQAIAMGAIGSADEIARNMGYEGGVFNQALLNREDLLQGRRTTATRASFDADVRSMMSGLGQQSPLQRMFEELMTATPDTNFTDVLGRVLGGVEREDVTQAWQNAGLDSGLKDALKEVDEIRGRMNPNTGALNQADQRRMDQLRKTISSTTSRMNEIRAETLQQARDRADAAAPQVDPNAQAAAAQPQRTTDPNDTGDLTGRGSVFQLVASNIKIDLEAGTMDGTMDVAPAQGANV